MSVLLPLQHCVNTITKALQNFPGVQASTVNVSLKNSNATFKFKDTENRNSKEIQSTLSETIEELGYDVGEPELILESSPSSISSETYSLLSPNTPVLKVTALSITGMTCSHCTNTIQKALQQLPSVDPSSVQVSLDKEEATMTFINPDKSITQSKIKDAIEDLGYDVGQIVFDNGQESRAEYSFDESSSTQTATFSLSGMTCQFCVKTVSEALHKLPGVVPGSVSVDLQNRQGTFSFEGSEVNSSIIKHVIEDLGYDLNGKPRFTKGIRRESLGLFPSQAETAVADSEKTTGLGEKDQGDLKSLRKVVMRVLGMTCQSCVSSVIDALQNEMPNVQPDSVHVSLQTEMAMFICTNPDIDRIHTVIEERGFSVENVQVIHNLMPPAVILSSEQQQQQRDHRQNSVVSLGAISIDNQVVSVPHKVTFQISGMTCASCVRTVERGLSKLAGVDPDSVQVNLLTHSGTFSVTNNDVLDEQSIMRAVKNMGYTASKIVFISSTKPPPSSDSTVLSYKAEMLITGMYCPNCIDKVYTALTKLHGIRSKTIQIHLDSGRSNFEFTGEFITRQRIHQAILQLGFSAESIKITKQYTKPKDEDAVSITSQKSSKFATTHLVVTGMTCSSCVANIERTMMKQAGVLSCQVNLLAKSAMVQHDPTIIGSRALAQMIEQIGYKAELAQDSQGDTIAEQRASMRATMDKELALLKSRFMWSLLFAVPVVLVSMIFMMALPSSNPVHKAFMKEITHGLSSGDLILFILSTPVQFWLGLPFYTKAYKSLVYSHTANMETLVAMGTTVAYLASVASVIAAMARGKPGSMSMNYFETSVLLITFIHFGKWLEALAKGKTAETITKLMDLQPETATLVEISKSTGRQSLDQGSSADSIASGKQVSETEMVLSEKEIESKDIQGKKNSFAIADRFIFMC
jgi:Cu+-exporting ATPase